MTYPDPDPRIASPIPVEIKNWAPAIKPPFVMNTTVKTYIVDPAGAAGGKYSQISDYEPKRLRLAILVIDSAVALVDSQPVTSPDASTNSTAPSSGGAYLPPNATAPMYEFFGPDAFWLNSLGTVTRVTVIKEYGS